MGYGEVMKPGIPENSDLVFDVELLSCEKDELADLDVSQIQDLAASGRLKLDDTTGKSVSVADDLGIWWKFNTKYVEKIYLREYKIHLQINKVKYRKK